MTTRRKPSATRTVFRLGSTMATGRAWSRTITTGDPSYVVKHVVRRAAHRSLARTLRKLIG